MAKTHRAHDEESWKSAKKTCRLTARQVEMARALGVNPKKLPKLRPSPHEHWKLPVGEYIEELYRERFTAEEAEHDWWEPPSDSSEPRTAGDRMPSPARSCRPSTQAASLICYLTNLAADLERWLAHGELDPDLLPQVRDELRSVANALDTGDWIPEVPQTPLPPEKPRRSSKQRRLERRPDDDFDDDVPF